MPTHSNAALPPTPARHTGFVFTCRRTAEGHYTFDAPVEQVEQVYEMTPEQMGEMLNAGRLPFLGAHDTPELWDSISSSAEQLSPWVRDVPVRGARTGRERWVRAHGLPSREADGAVVWTGLIIDITDVKSADTQRQDALEALARSEAWMRAALQGASMLGWDLDLVRNKWATTADIPDFYGVPRGPDYTDPETSLLAVYPDDVPVVLAGRKHAIETGEPMGYEFRG
jgi:hypothetical protein